MKKRTRKKIQDIINKKFLTDWEFIVEEIAPEIEDEDFNVYEVVLMIQEEIFKRHIQLYNDK
jgi:hypothetical protein